MGESGCKGNVFALSSSDCQYKSQERHSHLWLGVSTVNHSNTSQAWASVSLGAFEIAY